jgi:small subunit ribosomal protein S20
MANIKSAQKRVVSSQKKAVVNKSAKSELKTELKKGKLAIESGAADMASTPTSSPLRRRSRGSRSLCLTTSSSS